MSELGEYVLSLIQRHPDLSMRQASVQAGLGENTIQQIVKGHRPHPAPDVLRAIASQWGTDQDYVEMLRLSGCEIPLPPDVTREEMEVLNLFRSLSEEDRRQVLLILWALNGQDQTLAAVVRSAKIGQIALRAGELDEQGRQAILQMIEYINQVRSSENEPS